MVGTPWTGGSQFDTGYRWERMPVLSCRVGLLVLLPWVAHIAGCTAKAAPPLLFLGTWEVRAHAPAPISAMTDEEADGWLGKRMVVRDREVGFDGRSFPVEAFRVRRVAVADVFSKGDSVPSGLGIESETVLSVLATKEARRGRSFLLLDADRLITQWDGEWFRLHRVPNR